MESEMNKTREYTIPGDKSNPNRCRDDGVLNMLKTLDRHINGIVSAVTQLGLRVGRIEAERHEEKLVIEQISKYPRDTWQKATEAITKSFALAEKPRPLPSHCHGLNPTYIYDFDTKRARLHCPARNCATCSSHDSVAGAISTWNEYQMAHTVSEAPAKPTEPQQAGELREWWVVFGYKEDWGAAYKSHADAAEEDGRGKPIRVREIPSPERVREALDAFALNSGWPSWSKYVEICGQFEADSYAKILTLLRSLGVPTEGV